MKTYRVPAGRRLRIESVEYLGPSDEIVLTLGWAPLPWWARLHRALARLVGGE